MSELCMEFDLQFSKIEGEQKIITMLLGYEHFIVDMKHA